MAGGRRRRAERQAQFLGVLGLLPLLGFQAVLKNCLAAARRSVGTSKNCDFMTGHGRPQTHC
eukprot:40228-Chlamydomonas_euryale.AAC.1